MGSGRSKNLKHKDYSSNRRHEWGKVTDVPLYTDPFEEDEELGQYDEEYVEDEINWPRSCPVLHLDIKNDFILNEQKKLMTSLYRFWLYIFWISVLNFVATMATQLTAFITSSSQLVLSFLFAVISFFVVFFLYFRALYWAIRLDSNVLYIWFYIMSILMWAYYSYIIVIAISLMSILASPLSPGTQLPVKINPIFPMVTFTIVIFFFVLAIVYGFHYFAQAFKWQRKSEEEILQLLKKQRKVGWFKKWTLQRGEANDDDDGKDQYKCILQYEKLDEEGNVIQPPKDKKARNKSEKMQETLAVPGSLSFDDSSTKGFFATFKAEEAIFSYVFSLKIWLQNVKSLKKEKDDVMKIAELVNTQVPKEFSNEYKYIPAHCCTKAQVLRIIELDFNSKEERNKCYSVFRKNWRKAKKSKDKEMSEDTLESLRIGLLRRSSERSAKHLLTLKDWKELLQYAWRREYKAGDVIVEIGEHFHSLMHVSKGKVEIYLDTSSKTETGSEYASVGEKEDEGIEEVLFPGLKRERIAEAKTANLTSKQELDAIKANTDLTYTVTFERREATFFEYEIQEIVKKGQEPKMAAVVTSVDGRSQAGKAHVRKGDYIRKIEGFDVDKNLEILFTSRERRNYQEIRRRIDGALRAFPCPFVVQFYRPPAGLPPSEVDLDLYGYADDENIDVVVVGDSDEVQSFSFENGESISESGEALTITTEVTHQMNSDVQELEMAERIAETDDYDDETVEFLAKKNEERITHKPSALVRGVNKLAGLGRNRGEYEPVVSAEESKRTDQTTKSRSGIFERGSALLFGMTSLSGPIRSSAPEEEEPPYEPVEDENPISDDEIDSSSSSGASFDRLFSDTPTYENVGEFVKGDIIGLVPWIVNHPISVVQLVARTDVTIHSIVVEDVVDVLRKDPRLAIAFFKYVAGVIGERADSDEERLCRELASSIDISQKRIYSERLCRLLDNKPIQMTSYTFFQRRASWLQDLKKIFEGDEDLDFDAVIDKIRSVKAQVIRPYTRRPKNRQGTEISEPGTLFITRHYVCFRPLKHDSTKLHINDIYDLRRDENMLFISADKIRLEITFLDVAVSAYMHDLLHVLSETTSVERAPLSYTLPGEFHFKDELGVVADKALASIYRQQLGLRADLLALMNALEGVLTAADRVKLFRGGQSVTLKQNQNVTSAITTLVEVTEEDPNGLYLLGKGELVVQREVHGKRIQFASYTKNAVFGIERFLTGAPSPVTIKVLSKTATMKFAPYERCMAILRNDPPLAARFYQYCTLSHMKRLRGPVLSRPMNDADLALHQIEQKGTRGCTIL